MFFVSSFCCSSSSRYYTRTRRLVGSARLREARGGGEGRGANWAKRGRFSYGGAKSVLIVGHEKFARDGGRGGGRNHDSTRADGADVRRGDDAGRRGRRRGRRRGEADAGRGGVSRP